MGSIINIISILSASVFGVGMVYIILDSTIGRVKILSSEFEWHGLQIKDFVFLGLSVLIFIVFLKPVAF